MMSINCPKCTLWLFVAVLSCGAYAQIVNPIQAAKDAYKKAQQQKQQGQQPGAQPSSQGQRQNGMPAASPNGPFTPPPGTKIEPTLLAPREQGAQFSVSPRGVHVGTVSHNGSRLTVIYDGVPGPKFDQIFQQTSPSGIVFSPDGNHYAYCGLQGNEAVVMADGKEIYRDSHTNMQGGMNFNSCQQMSFSSNSKHLYFFSQSQCEASLDGFRFVWDGKPDTVNSNGDLRTYALSPDGDHVAYVWAGCGRNTTQKLLIDGKPAPYLAGNPQWSADSKHLYTTAARPPQTVELLEDGRPMLRANGIRLYIPPVGNMAVAAVTKSAPGGNIYSLVIGGKVVPGSEVQAPNVNCSNDTLTFSADGKHYAVECTTSRGGAYVFSDGKKGLEYRRLDPFFPYSHKPATIGFTQSGNPVYVGFNAEVPFLVVGDQESSRMDHMGEVGISPFGNHVMASALNKLYVDGKVIAMPQANRTFGFVFSPDGAHVAYGVQSHDGITVYLDGTPQTAFTGVEVTQMDGHNQFQSLAHFSPDSKHLAYFCRLADPAGGNNQGVCLDGKYLPIAFPGTLGNLTFSEDSNHLFWNVWSGPRFRAYVDGKPVVEGAPTATGGFDRVAFQEAGSNGLLILAQDADGLKRFSVTPAADSSLASMIR
jgi:hypothetical protein